MIVKTAPRSSIRSDTTWHHSGNGLQRNFLAARTSRHFRHFGWLASSSAVKTYSACFISCHFGNFKYLFVVAGTLNAKFSEFFLDVNAVDLQLVRPTECTHQDGVPAERPVTESLENDSDGLSVLFWSGTCGRELCHLSALDDRQGELSSLPVNANHIRTSA